jgi:hypothetical protein
MGKAPIYKTKKEMIVKYINKIGYDDGSGSGLCPVLGFCVSGVCDFVN